MRHLVLVDPNLEEISRRCKFLTGFDSFESSPSEVAAVVGLKL
ncbi:MAG TPA: hypothetical protein VJB08_00200 [Candidatus Nanoarchaeia archaeon]|nr:hypothetical protein [Candidatus Nanoarchaeia archaeon]